MYLRIIKICWTVFCTGFILAALWVVAVSTNWLGLFGGMPDLKLLENPKSELASELYSADGMVLGKYFRENRSPVVYNQISPNLLNALIATEDARFEEHSGIDFKGTFAIVYYLLKGNRRGSSTITQQLAKNLFHIRRSPEYEGYLTESALLKKLIAKTKEWILAIDLERSYTKKEILEMYLNTVDFGSNAFGIKVAAKTYFNTTPDSLNVQQSAVLVGMLKAPFRYSPIYNPENSVTRRNIVLVQMQKYGFLTPYEVDSLQKLPIVTDQYDVENHHKGLAPYFRTVMNNYLLKWCRENGYDLYADGLKIYTTIDSRMQQYAEQAVETHMKSLQATFFKHWKGRNPWVDENMKEIKGFLDRVQQTSERYKGLKKQYGEDSVAIAQVMHTPVKMKVFTWTKPEYEMDTLLSPIDSIRYYKHFLRAGLMSMDPHTGQIKAWVGGINHKYFSYDHVMQGRRQPGSTFKPIVYAAAISEHGYSPCIQVQDVPQTFVLEAGGTWTAQNSNGGYSGATLTLRQALARSINTVAAYLMRKLKPAMVVDYARKLGINSPLEEVYALCLGSSDVSVYELTGAYATFVNKGMWIEPAFITRIEDKNGKVIFTKVPKTKEALSEETAYIMTYMLRGPTEEPGGTATGLFRYKFRQNNEVAAKTGTTSNYSDGWFVGCTKDLVTGVWVGGDDRSIHFRSIDYGSGARMAMPAFGMYMDKVYGDPQLGYTKGKFPAPEGKLSVELNCSKYRQMLVGDSTQYIMPSGSPLKELNE